jgi:alkylhydroperoxidase family enzyme
MEAHSLFLQAAGMAADTVFALTECEAVPGLTARQQALVSFAEKLTHSPQIFTSADTNELRGILDDEGEVIEAANVVAGFNFANRVADALDVPREVPKLFRRYRWSKYAVMTLMSLGIRMRMNFKNRTLESSSQESILTSLQEAMTQAGMGTIPSYFQRLRIRPHILAGQATICISLLSNPGLPWDMIVRIGYLVASLNQDTESITEFARLARKSDLSLEPIDRIAAGQPTDATIMARQEELLLYVRDITLHADLTTDQQVISLQRHGLTDVQILNLVLITAGYNAGNRLSRVFSDSCSASMAEIQTG